MNNEISVSIYLGKLTCSIAEQDAVLAVPKEIPGFEFCQRIKSSSQDFRELDPECALLFYKYMDMDVFRHKVTGDLLRICSRRRTKCSHLSPLFVLFDSPSLGAITCQKVFPVRDHLLKKYNLHLQPAELFLIVGLEAPKGTGIHKMVIKSIVVGETRGPYRRMGEIWLFDRVSSPSRVAVSDMATELETHLGMRVDTDCCVIEVGFRLARVKGMPTTFEELAVHDWSDVYGKHFALREPSDLLEQRIEYKEMLDSPIWALQEFMELEYGIAPSEFYRDYVQDHPLLSTLVRDALAQYRWCPDYQGKTH